MFRLFPFLGCWEWYCMNVKQEYLFEGGFHWVRVKSLCTQNVYVYAVFFCNGYKRVPSSSMCSPLWFSDFVLIAIPVGLVYIYLMINAIEHFLTLLLSLLFLFGKCRFKLNRSNWVVPALLSLWAINQLCNQPFIRSWFANIFLISRFPLKIVFQNIHCFLCCVYEIKAMPLLVFALVAWVFSMTSKGQAKLVAKSVFILWP